MKHRTENVIEMLPSRLRQLRAIAESVTTVARKHYELSLVAEDLEATS